MKGFNQKRFISSLVASAMVAAATLAPLPGLLATGSVHATSATDFVQIGAQARLISGTTVNVPVTYRCAPSPAIPATSTGNLENILVQVTQPMPIGNGFGFGVNAAVLCNGLMNQTTVTVNAGIFGGYSQGPASASATLRDSNGLNDVGTSQTISIVP